MIVLTTFEKREFVKRSAVLTKRISQDENDTLLFFKVLVNFLDKMNVNKLNLSKLNESILENNDLLQKHMNDILEYMANIAAEESDLAPQYTTGQLAKFFGVSITTINNWINEGRFIGVTRDEINKQVRISANTLYRSRNGKIFPISMVVKQYEEEQSELGENLNDFNEAHFIINQLAMYEDKYEGDFMKAFGGKPKEELSAEELTDFETWYYFLRRQEALNVYGNTEN